MHDLFTFEQTGVDEQRVAQGHFQATGILPQCLDHLKATGVPLPFQMFERRLLHIDRLAEIQQGVGLR